ncbi:MAG: methyltransferase domain-containing protein [Planctomycetota bacterium]
MERILEPEYMDTVDEATDYDAMDHRVPNEAFVDRLVALGARGLMLDLGCGPGHMPPMVAARVPGSEVVGLDAASTMLAIAERRRLGLPGGDRVRYIQGDAKALPFSDGEFEAVFSNTVLHHIPDPRPFLREAWRVLAPGGLLAIRDLFRPPNAAEVDRLVVLHAADANPVQRELFRASLHAALEPDELRAQARECGLTGVEVTVDSDRHQTLQGRRPNSHTVSVTR